MHLSPNSPALRREQIGILHLELQRRREPAEDRPRLAFQAVLGDFNNYRSIEDRFYPLALIAAPDEGGADRSSEAEAAPKPAAGGYGPVAGSTTQGGRTPAVAGGPGCPTPAGGLGDESVKAIGRSGGGPCAGGGSSGSRSAAVETDGWRSSCLGRGP